MIDDACRTDAANSVPAGPRVLAETSWTGHRRLLLLLFAVLVSPVIAEDSDTRPNVLFIAVDDLNDWVGFLGGHPQALTPNMDRLAKRGVVFTNAHCASPACNPSRAAVFSGRMPWQTGVWSNLSNKLFQQNESMPVLPDSFREAGYATWGTGKMMHSGDKANTRLFADSFGVEQRWSPLTRKAVEYTPAELPSKGTDNPQHVVQVNGRRVVLPLNRMPSDRNPTKSGGESFDWGPVDVDDGAMGDTQITDWAVEKIASADDQPFFLGVGYYRPHIPLWAPAKYFERFRNQKIQLPAVRADDADDLSKVAQRWALEADTAGLHSTVVKYEQWAEAVKSYLACTTYVDSQIGRLIDALDAGTLGEKTMIVLWTDHGWHLGEKQHWGKWTGWERSTRVPLVIVPSKQQAAKFDAAGSRCSAPVSLIDLYPTLTELCDLSRPTGLDGTSLVPLLHDTQHKSDRVALTSFNPGNVSIRNQELRLIRYEDGTRELYDLTRDPNEWTNLAGEAKFAAAIQELESKIPAASAGSTKSER